MTTTRQRFKQICRFERCNDPAFFGIYAWYEAYERWVREGMPVDNLENMKQINLHFLGYENRNNEAIIPNAAVKAMGKLVNPPWASPLEPQFEEQIIEDEGETVVKRDFDGALVRTSKSDPHNMPQWLEYPVTDRKSWDAFKRRVDPHTPARWPEGWDIMTDDKLGWPIRPHEVGKSFEERDFPLGMIAFSLFSCTRNYMGIENLGFALYDDPPLVEDILEWQTCMAEEMIRRVFAAGITIDWVWIWEDMAYNNGSLVSLDFVKRVMAPRYRRVCDLLQKHGVTALIVDCDGKVDDLIPIWMDCGVNAVYPFERASGMDCIKVRKEYKDLVMIGNVDKRELAKGKDAIDREVDRIRILLKDGGFFPGCDHHIPADVPYENLVYFHNQVYKLSDYEETRRVIEMPG